MKEDTSLPSSEFSIPIEQNKRKELNIDNLGSLQVHQRLTG